MELPPPPGAVMKCHQRLNKLLSCFFYPHYIGKLAKLITQKLCHAKLVVTGSHSVGDYTPIAFDERVTFWLQRARSLSCACTFAALYACVIA